MGTDRDPYRTLGLARGASLDEVRRAYRLLAKANHPDSAGESALPRFLAIQAAYETLVGGGRARRPGAQGGGTRDSWRADPDRARSTGEAHASRPGRPPGSPSDGAPPRPRRSTGRAGAQGGGATSRPAGGRPSSPPGGRRSPNKATPGSTTYDAADEEPFDPEWSGATWYGTSSGTYWTINPKEYADPRKHGPEYQRRARRGEAEPGEAPPFNAESATPGPGADPDQIPVDDRATTNADASTGRRARRARPEDHGLEQPLWAGRAGDQGRSGSTAGTSGADPFTAAEVVRSGLWTPSRGLAMRLGIALVAWPPLGVALSTVVGEVTGCGRFAAGCVQPFAVETWLAQLMILAILVAAPTAAALAAVGTVAALAAAVPTAVVLSAAGGSREPTASASLLGAVLAVAWLAGVLFAAARRRRAGPLP